MIYIDIETLPPLGWSDDQVDAYVRERVPGTFKKPESIAQWCEENRMDVFAKAALDWRVSRIACIGVVHEVEGEAIGSAVFDGGTNDNDERRCLHAFELWLSTVRGYDETLCGHNILGFDLPRLHITAARLRHVLAGWFRSVSSARHRVVDTMHLAFPSRERVSLADLSQAVGVGAKSGHGSEVLTMWLEGRHAELRDYCLQDVKVTRQVYRALVGDLAEEDHGVEERLGIVSENMDRAQVASLIDTAMRGGT